MIKPRDVALDTFEAALAMLCGAYEGAGLSRAEIQGALERRLRAFGGAVPFDPARQPEGAEVFVEGGEHGL